MTSWVLQNAVELANANPATFHRPSRTDISKLAAGNYVKLVFKISDKHSREFDAERMWVKITKRQGDAFESILDNTPVVIHDLKAGDDVSFRAEHIIDTFIQPQA